MRILDASFGRVSRIAGLVALGACGLHSTALVPAAVDPKPASPPVCAPSPSVQSSAQATAPRPVGKTLVKEPEKVDAAPPSVAQIPTAPASYQEVDQDELEGMRLLRSFGPEKLWAAKHFEKACNRNRAEACNQLGILYLDGEGGAPRDRELAEKTYVLACDLGSPAACSNIGGLNRETNSATAAQYYAKACELEHPNACERLAGTVAEAERACTKTPRRCNNWGVILKNGWGVPQDEKRAQKVYEVACASGSPEACHNAGLKLMETMPAKAKKLFQSACALGYDASCLKAQKL